MRLPLGGWASLAIVIVLALLTFVPIRHLYPSQPGLLNRVSMIAGVVWTPLVAWLIWKLPDGDDVAPDRVDDAARDVVAPLPALLPGRLVGDQRAPLAEAMVPPQGARGPRRLTQVSCSFRERLGLFGTGQALAFGDIDLGEQERRPRRRTR